MLTVATLNEPGTTAGKLQVFVSPAVRVLSSGADKSLGRILRSYEQVTVVEAEKFELALLTKFRVRVSVLPSSSMVQTRHVNSRPSLRSPVIESGLFAAVSKALPPLV